MYLTFYVNIPQIYILYITFEKCSSSMCFLENLANVWTDDHLAALFICLMDKPLNWQCEVEAERVEYDPNTVISTPVCWSFDTHHLERVEVEIGLCGFTKLSWSLLDFLILFVTSLYFSRCDRAQILASLYRIKVIGSSWCPGCVFLNSSVTNIVTLSVSNFIRSKFI